MDCLASVCCAPFFTITFPLKIPNEDSDSIQAKVLSYGEILSSNIIYKILLKNNLNIELLDSIKEIGNHKVNINLGEDLVATLKIKVNEESE